MMKLGVRSQRWLKAFHIVFSGAWVGTTLGALFLNVQAGKALDGNELSGFLNSAFIISDLIILASVGTIVTGLFISWFTAWGFFKYWSVIFQIAGAIAVILIAKIWLDPAGATLRTIAAVDGLNAFQNENYKNAFTLVVVSAAANFVILMVTSLVATIKPWGRVKKYHPLSGINVFRFSVAGEKRNCR